MTAKKSNRKPTSNKPAAQKPAEPKTEDPRQPAEQGTAAVPPADQIVATTPPPADVPRHRQCPVCFEGMGGTGKAYSTHGSKTYYRCDCCGHTWTARVTHSATVIEHKKITVDSKKE